MNRADEDRLAFLESRLAEAKMFTATTRLLLAHVVVWLERHPLEDPAEESKRRELVANIKAQLRARG